MRYYFQIEKGQLLLQFCAILISHSQLWKITNQISFQAIKITHWILTKGHSKIPNRSVNTAMKNMWVLVNYKNCQLFNRGMGLTHPFKVFLYMFPFMWWTQREDGFCQYFVYMAVLYYLFCTLHLITVTY